MSNNSAPTQHATLLKTSLRLSLAAVILYSIAKLLVFSLNYTAPYLSTTNDPILGILLLVVGLNWLAFGVWYFIQSTQSKKFSAMYASLLNSDNDHHSAFKTGQQAARKHQLRAVFASFTGLLMLATAIGFLFLVAL